MSETGGSVQEFFVISKRRNDPKNIFTTDLGDGRVAACVFSQREHAMLFAMNAQGLDTTSVSPIDSATLREELEAKKRDGATHVLLDPSAGAGAADGIDIEEFIAKIED